jgi:hypothetical protein
MSSREISRDERVRLSRERRAARPGGAEPSAPSSVSAAPSSENDPPAPTSPRKYVGDAPGPGGDASAGGALSSFGGGGAFAAPGDADGAGDTVVDMGWGEANQMFKWGVDGGAGGAAALSAESAAGGGALVVPAVPRTAHPPWDAFGPDATDEPPAAAFVSEPLRVDHWADDEAHRPLIAAAHALRVAAAAAAAARAPASWSAAAAAPADGAPLSLDAELARAAWAITETGALAGAASFAPVRPERELRERLTRGPFDDSSGVPAGASAAALVALVRRARAVARPLGGAAAPVRWMLRTASGSAAPGCESALRGALGARPWALLLEMRASAAALEAAAFAAAANAGYDDNGVRLSPAAALALVDASATPAALASAAALLAARLPLLRVAAAARGDELADARHGKSAADESATALLHVRVGGLVFRDHPLFSAEDFAASRLRGVFSDYARRLEVGGAAVARIDARLRALLAGASAGGADASGFDFFRDGLADLNARAANVLELLSARADEVTSVASLIKRAVKRAKELDVVRTSAGFVVSPLRLVVSERPRLDARPLLFDLLLNAEQLISKLRSAAEGGSAAESGSDGLLALPPSGLATTALRLCDEFTAFLNRTRADWDAYGHGYSCGGLGSGVVDDADVLAAAGVDAGGDEPGAREFSLSLLADRADASVALPVDAAARKALGRAECARRAAIAALRVSVRVVVNGREVASSPSMPVVAPGFLAAVDLDVSLRLRKRPSTLAIRVVDDRVSLWNLVAGGPTLAEVLVPVPGAADSADAGRGTARTWGAGRAGGGGAPRERALGGAAMAAHALAPVSGLFSFSASTPLDDPPFDVADSAASAPSAPPAAAISTGFQPLRLLCGDVGVSVEWGPPAAGGGAGGGPADALSLVPHDSKHLLLPPAAHEDDGGGGGGGGKRGARAALALSLSALRALRAAQSRRGLKRSAQTTVGRAPSAGAGAAGAPAPHAGLLADLASVPVPRVALAASGAAPGDAARWSSDFGASRTLALPGEVDEASGGGGGASPTARDARAPPPPPPAPGFPGATLRRSQAVLAKRALVDSARAAHASTATPAHGTDPNDPRHAAPSSRALSETIGARAERVGGVIATRWGRGAAAARSSRFRVAALPRSLTLAPAGGGGGTALGGPLDASGLGALVGGIGAALPGRARLALLRLRAARPENFAGVGALIPLADADFAGGPRVAPLRALLRDALIALGVGAASVRGGGASGVKELLRVGATALRIPVASVLANGLPGSPEWAATGGGSSATAAVSARLIARIKDFLLRMRSLSSRARAAGAESGSARVLALSGVVREVTAPSIALTFSFAHIAALLAPTRRMRPKAIDYETMRAGAGPGPVMIGGGGDAHAKGRDANALNVAAAAANAALTDSAPSAPPAFRINIQVRSARNLPTRRSNNEPVSTFVEARFKLQAQRTSPVSGSCPFWNQLVSLGFTPTGGDASPARLAQESEDIVLSIFDEFSVEARADERDLLTTLVRRERRFLGSVTIPFRTLLEMKGVINLDARLDTPSVTVGYNAPELLNVGPSTSTFVGGVMRSDDAGDGVALASGIFGGAADSSGEGMVSRAENSRVTPHLNFLITVDPALPSDDSAPPPPPPPPRDDSLFGEISGAFRRLLYGAGVTQWVSKLTEREGPNVARLEKTRGIDSLPEGRELLSRAAAFSDTWTRPPSSAAEPSLYSERNVSALVSNSRGELVLCSRYLHALLPPPDAAAAFAAFTKAANAASQPDSEAENAAVVGARNFAVRAPVVDKDVARTAGAEAAFRFVELLPFLSDSHGFGGDSGDVWCTVAESLEMGAGDAEEHALMLANFLLYFDTHSGGGRGWSTYIVTGRADPEGEAVWVLRKNSTTTLFIDPCSRRCFVADDESSPLRAIGMVFNSTNVWANTQLFTRPSAMTWDFNLRTAWA